MIVNEVLLNDIKPYRLTDMANKAQVLIEETNLSHLPILDDKACFIGCLAAETILDLDADVELRKGAHHLLKFAVSEDSLFFDCIRHFELNDSNMLVVVDNQQKYKGYVLAEDILKEISKYPLISEPGGIIIISTPIKKYAVSEIAKIVESNNSRLLGCFISAFIDDRVEVTLKISSSNLSTVLRTFERFEYQIVFKHFVDSKEELIEGRYKQLMNYLKI